MQCVRQRDGLDVLRKAPGPAGVMKFLAAATERNVALGTIASLRAAAEAYEALVGELGGSQTRLLSRLAPHSPPAPDADGPRLRLFRAAAELLGRWSEVGLFLSAYAPTRDGAALDRLNVTGFIGHRARPDAMPLTTGSGRLPQSLSEGGSALTLDGQPAEGSTPLALLEDFCSRPLPRVTSRRPTSGLRQIIEIDASLAGTSADVVTARVNARPIAMPSRDDPEHAVWMFPNVPSRMLLADVYLHRSLARAGIPSACAQMTDAHHLETGEWATRFRDQPILQVLGRGLARADTPAYARQAELTRHLFQRVGWDPEQFVGFRCEVAYPIWRAGYCIYFDFSSEPD